MKEASGELSMSLIVIVIAAAILGIFYLLREPITNTIKSMWGKFDNEVTFERNTSMVVTHSFGDYIINIK